MNHHTTQPTTTAGDLNAYRAVLITARCRMESAAGKMDQLGERAEAQWLRDAAEEAGAVLDDGADGLLGLLEHRRREALVA